MTKDTSFIRSYCGGSGLLVIFCEATLINPSVLVAFAHNIGEEAIALYVAAKEAGKPFRFVIMDLTIPGGMVGAEAAQRILAIDPEAELIVSSGYSDDPIMANFRTYGFYGALDKPYSHSDLGAPGWLARLFGHRWLKHWQE